MDPSQGAHQPLAIRTPSGRRRSLGPALAANLDPPDVIVGGPGSLGEVAFRRAVLAASADLVASTLVLRGMARSKRP